GERLPRAGRGEPPEGDRDGGRLRRRHPRLADGRGDAADERSRAGPAGEGAPARRAGAVHVGIYRGRDRQPARARGGWIPDREAVQPATAGAQAPGSAGPAAPAAAVTPAGPETWAPARRCHTFALPAVDGA